MYAVAMCLGLINQTQILFAILLSSLLMSCCHVRVLDQYSVND